MKITQIQKINDAHELDNFLNPKTTPVGLLKTMFNQSKDLNIIKINTKENYGTMLYDTNRNKYMVFVDAKYLSSTIQDGEKIRFAFNSLAKDFKDLDKSLFENNKIKEFKKHISENEAVKEYEISIESPDLIISMNENNSFAIIDDARYGTLSDSMFDKNLIHGEKNNFSLNDFEDIIFSAKGEVIGRIAEIEEFREKYQSSVEHQHAVVNTETLLSTNSNEEQWQNIPPAR